MNISLKKSSRKDKKFMVTIDNKKTIHFGASGYSDFTKHKDKKRKDAYDARHKKLENWKDPLTAGFWAKWVLWNKPTIAKSVKNITNSFPKLKIKIKINT